MKTLVIALGADHRGYSLKEYIKEGFVSDHYAISWVDVGAYTDVRSDYPVFAQLAVHTLLDEKAQCAILFCGTGIGMAVVANRFPKIYAGVAWNETIAHLSKEDDNVNVLVIPADYVTNDQAYRIILAWLHAEFKHDRYEKRIAMIDALENKNK